MDARSIAAALALFALAGCAGRVAEPEHVSKEPYFTGDIIQVPGGDVDQYWVLPSNSVHITGRPPTNGETICIRINLVIDSNGHLFNPKLVGLVGPKDFYPWTLSFFSGMHYVPAATNAARTPIQTDMTWSFARAGREKSFDECSAKLDKQQADKAAQDAYGTGP